MKFSHGVWTMREGVTATPVARISQHEIQEGELVLFGVSRLDPKANLNNYGFSIRLSSPSEGIIRVRTAHRQGRQRLGPDFALHTSKEWRGGMAEETPDGLIYRSGSLRAQINLRPFGIEFYDGDKLLTRSQPNQLAVMRAAGQRDHVMQRLSLSVGEFVYGMGERFSPLVRNGQSVSIWNEDPGTETDLSYKNIPLYLTNRGYGIFVNSPARVDFEVATERVYAVQFSVPENELDYFVISGPDPKGVLRKYTRLTGRPALPPQWSFGLWLSTSFLTEYDEKSVSGMIEGMRSRQVPLSVFHFDCLWMKDHHWCNFEWDSAKFPEAPAMLERLKADGVRICLWINPYISEFSALFPEGCAKGYFLKDASGNVYQRDDWQPQIAIVDFTNPAAVRWFQDKLRALMRVGVDCFKTDFGERIPADAVYFDGSSPERMHNYYAYLYNKAVYDLLVEERGAGEGVVFARSATVGCQQFPVHWGGDCDATVESMAETLRGGLSFGLSGGAFWSHDIGGFNETATPTLYKRWVAFGLLSSHSRLHGATSLRVPWAFDEESVDVLRHFCRLKMRLMPYLWSASVEAHRQGIPLMRAMVLEFPDDPAVVTLETQYMLGDRLLIAPVFDAAGSVSYYIPPGSYTDYETGEVREGGRFHQERNVSFFRTPLLVRPNTLLATGQVSDRPDYDYADKVCLELFELGEDQGAEAAIYGKKGELLAEFKAERRGSRIQFRAAGGKNITVVLRNIFVATPVNGELIESGERGTILKWLDPEQELEISTATSPHLNGSGTEHRSLRR